jgi:uncharacterized membrane protein YcfT
MTEAIFGLIGVLIGGLLNVGVAYVAERRVRKADVKVSARLLYSEIKLNQVSVRLALQEKRWGPAKTDVLRDDWIDHRATLANLLTEGEWSMIDDYFGGIGTMVSLAALCDYDEAIGDTERKTMQGLNERGDQSLEIVAKYAERAN